MSYRTPADGTTWLAQAAQSGELVLIRDAQKGGMLKSGEQRPDPRYDPTLDRILGMSTRTAVVAPIKREDGTVLGVLEVCNKDEAKSVRKEARFSGLDIWLLQYVAKTVAPSLVNAVTYQEQLRWKPPTPISLRSPRTRCLDAVSRRA